MNADQIKQQFPGYAGWNDPNSIVADFKATGGQGKGPSNNGGSGGISGFSMPSFDPIATAQKLRDFTIQSNQPAIQQYQSFIPQIQQQFAQTGQQLQAQFQPLEDRYNALLQTIKGNQQQSVNLNTQATTTGLGARGLLPSSEVGQTELANTLTPIYNQFNGQLGQTSAGHEQDINSLNSLISSLPGQQAEALRPIQSALALLQSGDPSSAVQNALQYTNQEQQAASQQAALQNQLNIAKLETQYQPLGYGGVYNSASGQTIQPGRDVALGSGGVYDPVSGQVIPSAKGGIQQLQSNSGGGQPSYQYRVETDAAGNKITVAYNPKTNQRIVVSPQASTAPASNQAQSGPSLWDQAGGYLNSAANMFWNGLQNLGK